MDNYVSALLSFLLVLGAVALQLAVHQNEFDKLSSQVRL